MRAALLTAGAFILTFLFYFAWWQSPLLPSLDYKIYDQLTDTFSTSNTPAYTVIIDIDDRSIKGFGQWPWPRMITAELINTLAQANPSAVALDIVFSEKDRTSPNNIPHFYRNFFDLNITINGLPETLKDNDRILSDAMLRTKTTLPVFSDYNHKEKECVLPHSVIHSAESKTDEFNTIDTLECSLPLYQRNAQGIGHIHASADQDGTLRRLSLLMRHNNTLIPTLGLAALASTKSSIRIYPVSRLKGDMGLEVMGEHAAIDRYGNGLVTFYPVEQYQRISAYDVLSGNYDPSRLRGKFVFIGSTVLGLDTWHTISSGSIVSGVSIHATLVENILNGDLKVQPSLYPPLNFFLSLTVGLVLMVLMLRKRYLSILSVVFTVFTIAAFAAYLQWENNIYLSLGYFIVPLLSYLFLLAIIMFFVDYYSKKTFIEELALSIEKKERLKRELERSENEKEYQQAMLLQQSKLAAMGEMIDNIAHQWRQPLNLLGMIIQKTLYVYKSGRVDENYLKKMTSESMEQILHMSQTIEDFRNFVKPHQADSLFDLNEPVEQSLQLLSPMLESHEIIVNVTYSQQPLLIYGSHSEFKQVIINLLQNARDALIENHASNPTITIRIFGNEIEGKVSIQDNGGGIAPEIIGRIFEPYFTTKEEGRGSGIGLYMSYAIIRTKMGGRIEVNNIAEGTLFTLTLPL
jgi:signal transduction histidine kinase